MPSSRPIQYEERATIHTGALLFVVGLGALIGWIGWRLTQLPPGAVWWQF